jgi:hypothetical protein
MNGLVPPGGVRIRWFDLRSNGITSLAAIELVKVVEAISGGSGSRGEEGMRSFCGVPIAALRARACRHLHIRSEEGGGSAIGTTAATGAEAAAEAEKTLPAWGLVPKSMHKRPRLSGQAGNGEAEVICVTAPTHFAHDDATWGGNWRKLGSGGATILAHYLREMAKASFEAHNLRQGGYDIQRMDLTDNELSDRSVDYIR